MGVMQRFERRLEGLIEGTFAKVFGGVVQPVEVAAALQREAGDHKVVVGEDRVLVPNEFVVELGQADAERLMAYEKQLCREFAAMVSEHAEEQGWSFVGSVKVSLENVPDLGTGVFRVRSAVVAGAEPKAPPAPGVAKSPWVEAPAEAPARFHDSGQQPVGPAARKSRFRGPEGVRAAAPEPPPGPRLLITERLPEGRTSEREVPLTLSVTKIGRGTDADIRIADTGVSRLHAEIHLQRDFASLVDLRSTNGTTVNGQRVQRSPLADGDRIGMGSTGITFRHQGKPARPQPARRRQGSAQPGAQPREGTA